MQGPAALTAEQVAVAAALLWIAQARAAILWIDCCMYVDCLAAGQAAIGQWAPVDELSTRNHHLEQMLREIEGVQLQVEHVRGHAGNGWNEVADGILTRFSHPPREACVAFLCTDLAWVSTELAARATGALCLERGGMVWNEAAYEPFHLQVEQLVPIGDPPGPEAMPSQGFYMSACTFNVQGIGGNHRYLEEQFEHQGYHLVMLQETKSAAGQCESSRYYRLASPADRYWGVSIWFNKRLGIFELDGTPIAPSEADLRVLVATPRLLAVQVMVGTDKIGLHAAHCPHQVRAPSSWCVAST